MNKYLIFQVLILLVVNNFAIANDKFWGIKQTGWFWYEQKIEVSLTVTKKEEPKELKPQEIIPPEVIAHKKLQKDFEEKRSIAIMNPSNENVLAYLQLQQEILNKSSVFADVWQRIIWTNPNLDYQFTHRPTNAVAINAYDNHEINLREEILKNLAKDHGLFFLFADNCIYCQQMATTLKRLGHKHNFVIQAISINNAQHPAFPFAWSDNGFAKTFNIQNYPALLLAKLTDNKEEIIPIGYGALSEQEIEERITVLTTKAIGTRF